MLGHHLGTDEIVAPFGHHAWIYVRNLTNESIYAGALGLEGMQKITVGTWHSTYHDGVWYNMERFYADEFSETNSVSLVKTLTASELATLNNAITNSSNDKWNNINNCSWFAAKMWNTVSDYEISPGIIPTPITLRNNMVENAGATTGLYIAEDLDVYVGGSDPQIYYIFD